MKTDNSNAFLIEFDLSIQIRCFGEMATMSRAIEFNSKLRLFAEKIDDAIPNWVLPAKFQIC